MKSDRRAKLSRISSVIRDKKKKKGCVTNTLRVVSPMRSATHASAARALGQNSISVFFFYTSKAWPSFTLPFFSIDSLHLLLFVPIHLSSCPQPVFFPHCPSNVGGPHSVPGLFHQTLNSLSCSFRTLSLLVRPSASLGCLLPKIYLWRDGKHI